MNINMNVNRSRGVKGRSMSRSRSRLRSRSRSRSSRRSGRPRNNNAHGESSDRDRDRDRNRDKDMQMHAKKAANDKELNAGKRDRDPDKRDREKMRDKRPGASASAGADSDTGVVKSSSSQVRKDHHTNSNANAKGDIISNGTGNENGNVNGNKEKDKATMTEREREERKRKKKKKSKRKRSKDRDDKERDTHRNKDRDRRRERDRERDRDHDRERHTHELNRRRRRDSRRDLDAKGERGRKGRHTRSSGCESVSVSSRDVDDSYGHFEGGPGTIIHGQYKLLKDVGLGTFGRVVQAIDLKQQEQKNRDKDHNRDHRGGGNGSGNGRGREREGRKSKIRMENTVAIKIVRSVKRYHESALIEAEILKDVNSRGDRGQSLCAVMLRRFDLPQGHCCLVFECLGRSLYDFMKTHGFKPFPLFCVRDFARQLLDALDFIHSFGLIHTDLKPENILLKSNKERPYRLPDGSDQQVPASTSIKLIDFGGATYDRDKKSTVINTRQYRAPEVILGLGWSIPSDLWSAGCIIAELYKGDLLFATHDNSEHLALMERIIGRLPLDMVSRSKQFGSTVFDVYGWHKMELSSSSKTHVRKNAQLENLVKGDDKNSGFSGLLRSLLTIDPAVRSTAIDALKAPFFVEDEKRAN